MRPYPKMSSTEAQAIVNAACAQVQRVIWIKKFKKKRRNSLKIKTVIMLGGSNGKVIVSSSRPLKNPRNLL